MALTMPDKTREHTAKFLSGADEPFAGPGRVRAAV